ncbi:putative candidate secreted effector protein [Blumeria hordei DH14]|uniref:Putative candidate secreted effector protein n=1 Tax=Blumeria graminis f. sp. hordei (strain DH14) TaxID=546991 RepID=N1JPA4_BLUG1|nr:putative candidate secreted effector protein [Blumeria hordei DH14]
MQLHRTLTVIPFIFSVYVAGEHGYLCSDAEGIANTFYDQALVEKSVTNACLPNSELSAAQLAANVEAKNYPQVWVDSEDYGFNETVLLWKYQGNSSESLEETNVFVFTNKSCDILGLLQTSGDQFTVCKSVNEQNEKKTSPEILSKKPRPGTFSNDLENYANSGHDEVYADEEDTKTFRIARRGGDPPNPSNAGGSKEKPIDSSPINDAVGSQRGSQGNSSGPQNSMPGPPRPDRKLGDTEDQRTNQETSNRNQAARGGTPRWIMSIDGNPYLMIDYHLRKEFFELFFCFWHQICRKLGIGS